MSIWRRLLHRLNPSPDRTITHQSPTLTPEQPWRSAMPHPSSVPPPVFNNAPPGSQAAVERGCTCPRDDNRFGEGSDQAFGEGWEINVACPLHGPWWSPLHLAGMGLTQGLKLEKLWAEIQAASADKSPAPPAGPAFGPSTRQWQPQLSPVFRRGREVRLYAYATSFVFGVMDAEAVADPWAIAVFDAQLDVGEVRKLSDRVKDVALQGVRPLSTVELEVFRDLWTATPSQAAIRLWKQLNRTIADRLASLGA